MQLNKQRTATGLVVASQREGPALIGCSCDPEVQVATSSRNGAVPWKVSSADIPDINENKLISILYFLILKF